MAVVTRSPLPAPGGSAARGASGDGTRPRLGYRPALDGLRALAVIAVLAYHGGLRRAPGGFLGVDVFFVLSGYLITALLLVEWDATGRLDLRRFWARRARRLLPALCVVVLAVMVPAVLAHGPGLAARRGDALATLGYVANWRFAFGDQSYFAAFSEASPLRHAWSLGIEEQWYLIWPLLLVGLLALSRGSRLRRVVAVLGLAAASAVLMAALFDPGADPSRVYYGTDTRVQGLLLGAGLALVVHRVAVGARLARALEAVGVAGLLVVAWAVVTVGDADAVLYQGGLAGVSLAAAAVVLAAVQPGSPVVGRALSVSPLRALGRISYGVYLWHWPLFLWLTPDRTSLTGWPLWGLRVAATLAVASLSFRLIEAPIREGRWWVPRLRVRPLSVTAGAMVLTAALVAATALVSTSGPPGSVLATPLDRTTSPDGGSAPGPATPTLEDPAPLPPAPSRPVRVLVAGDSVGLTLGTAAPPELGDYLLVDYRSTHLGCGIATGVPLNAGRPVIGENPECRDWPARWRRGVDEFRPDVVVVLLGAWEVLDHRLDGRHLRVGSDGYADDLAARIDEGFAILGRDGARVVVLTTPCFDVREQDPRVSTTDRNDPTRVAWFNEVLLRAAAANPDVVVADLGDAVCPGGRPLDRVGGTPLRADGAHYTPGGGALVWRWVTPLVVRSAAR